MLSTFSRKWHCLNHVLTQTREKSAKVRWGKYGSKDELERWEEEPGLENRIWQSTFENWSSCWSLLSKPCHLNMGSEVDYWEEVTSIEALVLGDLLPPWECHLLTWFPDPNKQLCFLWSHEDGSAAHPPGSTLAWGELPHGEGHLIWSVFSSLHSGNTWLDVCVLGWLRLRSARWPFAHSFKRFAHK